MLIEDLVPGVNLEDERTEFKGTLLEGAGSAGENLEIGWLKTLCGFANSFGGTLYVGVDNKTHELLSLSQADADRISLLVQRKISEHIEPPLRYKISSLPVPSTHPIRYVLAIRVEKSKMPPLTLRFHGSGTIYVRHFGKTSVATGEEIRSLILSSDSVAFDMMETDQVFDSKDFSVLFRFYKEQNEGKELTEKELMSIGFMDPYGKTLRRGALLFKDDCDSARTLVSCSQFPGASKGGDLFLASQEIKGNLIDEFQAIGAFVSSHSINGFRKTESGNVPLVSYPKRALTEAIANALGHRNYFIQGGQIEVNLYIDRLEIVSPGSLIGTRWLDKEMSLSSIPPLRRNELICAVFSLLKIMDHKGSGFDKIEEIYAPYGKSFAPYATSDEASFCLVLPDLAKETGLIQASESPEVTTVESLSPEEEKILSCCYNQSRTAAEIADIIGVLPSTYFRKKRIQPLVEKGYLLFSATKPARYWCNKSKVFPK